MSDNKAKRDVKNQSYLKDDPSKVSLDSDNAVQDLISQDENNDQSEEQNEHDFRYSIDDIERKDERDEIRERGCKGKQGELKDKKEPNEGRRESMVYKNKSSSGELGFPAMNGNGELGEENMLDYETGQVIDEEMDPRLSEPIQPSGFRAMRPTRLVTLPNPRRETITLPPPLFAKSTEAYFRRTEGEESSHNPPPIPCCRVREFDPANLPRFMKPTEAFLRRTEGEGSSHNPPPIPCSLIREVDPTNLPRYMNLTEAAKRHYNGLLEPVVNTISAPLHLPREFASSTDRYPSTIVRKMESDTRVEVSSEDKLLLNEIARILKGSIQWGLHSRKSTHPSDCIQIKKFVGVPPDAEQLEREREKEKKVEVPSRNYMRSTHSSRRMEEEKKKMNVSGGERLVSVQSGSTRTKPVSTRSSHSHMQLDHRPSQHQTQMHMQTQTQTQTCPQPALTATTEPLSNPNERIPKKPDEQRDESHLPSYMRSTIASRRREEEIRNEKLAKSRPIGKRS